MISEVYNCDNMELMAKYPDNHWELAICDPPYGIGIDGQKEDKATNRKAHDFFKFTIKTSLHSFKPSPITISVGNKIRVDIAAVD